MTAATARFPTVRLGRLVKINNGSDYRHVEADSDTGIPIIGSGGPFAHANEALYSGEALLLGRKGTIDKPLHVDGSFWTVDTMFYAIANPQALTRFLFYVALTVSFSKISTNTALPSVTAGSLKDLRVPLPSLAEQRIIVDFLDRETAQIDELIAKQEQLILLLAERQSVLLAGALSGTGSVLPRHEGSQWPYVPLGLLSNLQSGLTLGKDVEAAFAVDMPYLRVANVQVGRVDLAEVKTVSVDALSWKKHQLFAGDVLMTEGGDIDKLGRGSIWGGQIEPCLHQNHVFAIRCGPKLLNRWLEYVLAGPNARTYFQTTAKKSTNLASTNSSVVKAFRLPLPSMDEQVRLVSELDKAYDGFRVLTRKATEMIALLKERRQALISAAVTGKIDVTGKV